MAAFNADRGLKFVQVFRLWWEVEQNWQTMLDKVMLEQLPAQADLDDAASIQHFCLCYESSCECHCAGPDRHTALVEAPFVTRQGHHFSGENFGCVYEGFSMVTVTDRLIAALSNATCISKVYLVTSCFSITCHNDSIGQSKNATRIIAVSASL